MSLQYGTVREDGRMYYGRKYGKEVWLTPEGYRRRVENRTRYQRECRQYALNRQYRKNEMDRNYYGKYDFARNLYYIGLTSAGKEVWGTKEQLEHDRLIHLSAASDYRKRCREQFPPTSLKFGSPHPTEPGLFCVRKTGNKLFWGDKDEYERRLELATISRRKQQIKRENQRREKIRSLGENRLRRGAVRGDGKIFYRYERDGSECWMTPERFAELKERSRLQRKKYERKKITPESQG